MEESLEESLLEVLSLLLWLVGMDWEAETKNMQGVRGRESFWEKQCPVCIAGRPLVLHHPLTDL